jgi:2,4-dienoyl-CoA reductase-like NADH-dependent reductase (Old Yellow Enzyme family)
MDDEMLAAGQVDLSGMTRALIAAPELPRKAREGRADDIHDPLSLARHPAQARRRGTDGGAGLLTTSHRQAFRLRP